MKGLKDLLLMGNPLLYQVSEPVTEPELHLVPGWISDLHNVMQEFRAMYHCGRAIAAPQTGVMKRIIYVNTGKPVVLINPQFTYLSGEMMDVWDDCMCSPHLLVRVQRHRSAIMQYLDEKWQPKEWKLENDLSELLQHEYDHLNGILFTMRAADEKAFRYRG